MSTLKILITLRNRVLSSSSSIVLLTGFLPTMSGCSTIRDGHLLKFQENVTVSKLDGRETAHQAGEVISMPQEPAMIESPGKISVLVVPMRGGVGVSEVKLRKVSGWQGPEFNSEVNSRLNQVVERVLEVQRALGRRQADEALRMISELRATYPELTYLDFLKASAYVMLGEREKARRALNSALGSFPNNSAGKALKISLGKE